MLRRRRAIPVPRLPARIRIARLDISSGVVLSIALALVVNVLLITGYFWSHGGQTTHVRVEANGHEFTTFIDGKRTISTDFIAAPANGGIVLTLTDDDRVASRPSPRGVDSVRVTDLHTGATLFQDNFDADPRLSGWISVRNNFAIRGGVLDVLTAINHENATGQLFLPNDGWTDYAVDVVFRNLESGGISVRAKDEKNGMTFDFRPFRHLDQNLSLVQNNAAIKSVNGPAIELPRSQPIKAMLAMTLSFYPYALLFALIAVGIVAWLQYVPQPKIPDRLRRIAVANAWLPAELIAVFAFVTTLYLNYSYLSHMPHIPDSVAYIFQAKILAAGHFAAPKPQPNDAFNFFQPPFIIISGNKWASIYPFGHPIILAVGQLLHAMWLMPPLLGAGSVAMIFAVGRKLYGVRTGILASLLLATSPFFLMNASSFMSHNTAVFYLLASLLFLIVLNKRKIPAGIAAGLFFGLIFNTRPLTGVALVPPFAVYLLARLATSDHRAWELKRGAGFIVGGVVMIVLFWIYNYGTTGHAFSGGYQASGNLGEQVGFGGNHSVAAGIENEQTQLTFLIPVLNGWPSYVGLMFVLLPFILGSRNGNDWFLLLAAAFVMGAWTLYASNGVAFGPRYWYESIPLLMLLAARGADLGAQRIAEGTARIRARFDGHERPLPWASYAVVYLLVLSLCGSSIWGWLLGRHASWTVFGMPETAQDMRKFNFTDDRLVTLVDDAKLHNSLVLVDECAAWYCYGSLFWRNTPTLDGNVVYARNLEKDIPALVAAYPDRQVYVADYAAQTLAPFNIAGQNADLEHAPVAHDIPVPPTATPSPMPTAISQPRPTPTTPGE